jgi:hypothetical protein
MSHDTTFTSGIGRLAVDRYDFKDHVDGYSDKHNADAITVTPGITLDGSSRTDVYTALTAISSQLADLALSGKGFLLVGDGYDTYLDSISTPDTPYDSSVPALNTYLNDVLNNSANPLHFRIRDGGVVMIKAGTYKFTGSVNVPAGIMLLGECFGTKIVNQMASPAPLFIMKADTARIPDNGVDSTENFIFCRESSLVNLTIADNFLLPKFLGDLSYKTPINNDSVNPLVSLEEGASLSCEGVNFVGKTTYTLGQVSDLTSFAIKTDSSVPSSTGTRLRVLNCSMDGFAIPIQFVASGGAKDNFAMSNSMVRGYGFLNDDFVASSNNTIIKLSACNANVSNNYLFGYDSTVGSAAYITLPGAPPVMQSIAKVTFMGNNVAIDRTNASEITTFQLLRFSGSINANLAVITMGNNFNGIAETDAGVKSKLRTVTSNYTVDSASKDYILLVDTSSAPVTVTLPSHSDSRTLIIKDAGGNSAVNNITLVRNGSSGDIDGYTGDRILATNLASWTLVSDGSDWYIV